MKGKSALFGVISRNCTNERVTDILGWSLQKPVGASLGLKKGAAMPWGIDVNRIQRKGHVSVCSFLMAEGPCNN